MKRVLFLSLAVFSAIALNSQAYDWVQGFGGSGTDKALGIDVDASGNSYVTGNFEGTITIGTYTLTAIGGVDVYVAKFASNGYCLWAFSEGGIGNEEGLGLGCDAAGNFAITGLYNGTPTFGTQTLSSASGYYCAVYNSSGTLQWVREFGVTLGGYPWDVDMDPFGRPVITGYFTNTETFGTTTLVSNGLKDGFVLRYDANGNFDWAVSFGGTMDEVSYAVNTDQNGNIFVTGRYYGTAYFGSLPSTGAGGNDVFLAKLDTGGNFVWVVSGGNCPGNDSGQGVDVDAQGNVTITGYIAFGTALFGTTYLNSNGLTDCFVARYTNNGNFLWAKSFGGTGDDYGSDLSLSISGSIFVGGYFGNTATFGNSTLISAGLRDVLILMLDTSGNVQFALSGGGTGDEYARTLSAGGGYVYFAGLSDGPGAYGAFNIGNNGIYDAVLGRIKYDEVGIDDGENRGITEVFPNPATTEMTCVLNSALSDNARYEIYDVTGNLILTQEISHERTFVDIAGLAQGCYVLRITNGDRITRKEFVKY